MTPTEPIWIYLNNLYRVTFSWLLYMLILDNLENVENDEKKFKVIIPQVKKKLFYFTHKNMLLYV